MDIHLLATHRSAVGRVATCRNLRHKLENAGDPGRAAYYFRLQKEAEAAALAIEKEHPEMAGYFQDNWNCV